MPTHNPASLQIFTLKFVACCHIKIGQKFLATVSHAWVYLKTHFRDICSLGYVIERFSSLLIESDYFKKR